MPLSQADVVAQHEGMDTSRLIPIPIPTDRTSDERHAVGRRHAPILITDAADPERLVLRSNPAWLRLLARMFAASLDRRLASGVQPESGRLLASRGNHLASVRTRAALAQNWHHLVERAHRTPVARSARVCLCRDRITRAGDDIRAMTGALSTPYPTPARGVAIASWLLSDADGPLYNPNSATDLRTALRMAIAELDPAASLPQRT
jgi:hypothetical protein